MNKPRIRFWVETALSFWTGTLFLLAAFSRTWAEQAFGVDPDKGSGTFEWSLVAALFAVAVVIGLLARRQYRRARMAAVAR
jgi:hypothetical protein